MCSFFGESLDPPETSPGAFFKTHTDPPQNLFLFHGKDYAAKLMTPGE